MPASRWEVLRTLIDRGKPEKALENLTVEAFIKLVADAERAPEIDKTKTVVDEILDIIRDDRKEGWGWDDIKLFRMALAEAVDHIVNVSNNSNHDGPCKPSCTEPILEILKGEKTRDIPYPNADLGYRESEPIETYGNIHEAIEALESWPQAETLFTKLNKKLGDPSGLRSTVWYMTGHMSNMERVKSIREWFDHWENNNVRAPEARKG